MATELNKEYAKELLDIVGDRKDDLLKLITDIKATNPELSVNGIMSLILKELKADKSNIY